jgi:sugar transferase (PEP-CTERM system associated)
VLRIFRHYLSVSALCLFACESAVMMFALFTAVSLLTAKPLFGPMGGGSLALLTPVMVTCVLMYSIGLYDRTTMDDLRRALPRLAALCVVCTPAMALAIDLSTANQGGTDARLAYGLSAALGFCGVLVARLSYLKLAKAALAPHRVLVVGAGKLAAEIEYLNAGRRRSECEVIGYATLAGQPSAEIPQSRTLAIKTSLLDLARERGAKEIVVALDDRCGVLVDPLLEARMNGITITSYLSFWEREARQVNLKGLDPSWLIYSDGFRIATPTNAVFKRLLDILASLGLLLFTLPTLVLAAIAIRLDSPGPIFYRQERVGRNGTTFTIYKFRTMRVDAEANGVPRWASLSDPRTTAVGSFLRMTRIDELPQIWNVLRGDMSFVGPRPERPFFVDMLGAEIPFYRERHRVRPGLTGWAQINYPYGASIDDARAKLSFDLYYVKNFSLLLDLLIILSTAHAVFFKKGAR